MHYRPTDVSKGEDYIASLLSRAGYKFAREVIIEGVKRKQALRYDFGIYSNGELQSLIEVQGQQHYVQVKMFQPTRADFTRYQEHDRIKISACLARGIPLYIIPYCDLETIQSAQDIFQDKYLAKSKWHNDKNNPYKHN